MREMIQSTTLMRGESVSLRDVVCRHGRGNAGGEEWSEEPGLAFPLAGVFRTHRAREEALADSNHVVFFNAGEAYRVSHPVDGGDATTLLSFSPCAVEDALVRRDPHALTRRGETAVTFPAPVAPSPRAIYALVQRLRRIARDGHGRELEIEESALAILDAAVALSRGAEPHPAVPTRPEAAAVRRRRADAVRQLLSARLAERIRLGWIAREVGVSPFHLAREFREETGLPIHRYLNRLRLRAAISRLSGAGENLVSIALDSGFSSHGHFSDAFRREFGAPPSHFRHPAPSGELSELRKILEA